MALPLQSQIQRGGAFLSGMIVPNIAAFLAWGVITAVFSTGGWLPNAAIAALISPMLLTLLPLLVGYSGGRLVYGPRGGVVGAVATMGAVAASDVPMFIGAMVLGPLGGISVRLLDRLTAGRFPAALQMLVGNFSAGILAALLAVVALVIVSPAVSGATRALGAAAGALMTAGLLPLAAVVIEPAKVLFLNNAINHGVLAPIGAAQAHAAGQSILFLLETNPGPGLGLLLAFWVWGGAAARESAPGAAVVHFLGGIHEIYFPYVLMQPLTLLALIAGGLAANVVFVSTGAGLVATPSPGSIFAEMALAPRGGAGAVLLGILTGIVATFAVATPIVRISGAGGSRSELEDAQLRSHLRKSPASRVPDGTGATAAPVVVFACDAGMGSSVIGAAILAQKFRDAGVAVPVTHASVGELPADANVVIVHASLEERARRQAPRALVYGVDNFVESPVYDMLVAGFRGSAPGVRG